MKNIKILYVLSLIIILTFNVVTQEKKEVEVNVLAKTSYSWDGNNLPVYPEGTPEITILDITIPPDVKLEWHKHPVINAGIMLKGELTVITEDKKILHLKAGDSIIEVVNTWHYGKNEGKESVRIIVFYAGVQDMPITIKQ